MTDIDILTGAIAAKVRGLEDVLRIYPRALNDGGAEPGASGLLAAVAADHSIIARLENGTTVIEVSIGVGDRVGAPATARSVADLISGALRDAGIEPYRLIVRVASVGR